MQTEVSFISVAVGGGLGVISVGLAGHQRISGGLLVVGEREQVPPAHKVSSASAAGHIHIDTGSIGRWSKRMRKRETTINQRGVLGILRVIRVIDGLECHCYEIK